MYSSEWNKSIQQLYSDRSKLIGLFYYLNSYLKKIRENDTEQNNNTVKSNTSEKCTENDSQNDISQNKSVSQKNAMQMSVDETKYLTKCPIVSRNYILTKMWRRSRKTIKTARINLFHIFFRIPFIFKLKN
ncbi:hypothetical protein PUN28_006066 [Cardiocondyla obscurior]|uniref:Uncharacterized protein n=1 Tax=Cardiocondyla obscurior TaxID=286306 RepID=A0AAW2G9G1_9HYME